MPATTDVPETATATESTAVTITAPFDTMTEPPEHLSPRWLLPWDDGFLAVGVRYPQALPAEFTPEVSELFPPEVVALFPDGLPPTQQEAVNTLTEAGLLEVVMDVLNEHPEVMDQIQSAPALDPELLASWSTNGDAWTPTELLPPNPIGDTPAVAVSGDRLTIAGSSWPDDESDAWIVTVSSTTDLQFWDTASFTVARPKGMSPAEEFWVTPDMVAANDDHWVVRVMVQDSKELWSGAWDGEPTMIDARLTWRTLLATSDGFLGLGPGIEFSPDGTTWTPAANYWIEAAAPLGDGVLAIARAFDRSSKILLLDATGTLITEVRVPELDDRFSAWGPFSSPAVIVMPESLDAGEQQLPSLLATADAETWLVAELSDYEPNLWRPPDVAATDGTIVLVGTPGSEPQADVWQRFIIPE